MAGIDNLTPWEKGQSGNPAGKVPGTKNRKTLIKMFAETELTTIPKSEDFKLPEGMTLEHAVVLALFEKAKQGDVAATKEILDSLYGKLKETVESTHTFTQMGNVKIGGKADAEELDFDVGKETETAIDEDDE